VSLLTSTQLDGVSASAITGLHSAGLAALTSITIGTLETAQIAGLNSAQITQLTSLQVGGLTSSAIATFNSTELGYFTSAEVSLLTSTQLDGVAAAAITGLSSAGLAAMSNTTLGTLATDQIASLSSRQLDAMTSVQVLALGGLTSSALMTLTASNIGALTSDDLGFVTPLVLDLNGDGIQTTTLQNGVTFDIDNDGKVEQTAWASRSDGLLVRDVNRDGTINNGGELFGSGTVLADGKKAADGYAALRALDSNLDGVIDVNDAAFAELMVWTDANGDGISSAGELRSLQDLGIASISLDAQKSTAMNNGNLIGLMGSYTSADGTTHQMGDVWFQTTSTGERVFDLSAVAKAAGGSVNMTNAQTDTLRVKLSDVLAVGQPDILSGTSQVTITGDSGDMVQLSSEGGAWSLAGTQTDGAETYMVYVNQNAQLLVNDKIHTIIV